MKAYLWIAAVSLAAACGGERKAEARTADEPTAVVLGASDVATTTSSTPSAKPLARAPAADSVA